MNTTNDRNVGVWLNTAEGVHQPRPLASVVWGGDAQSASFRWNVTVLLAAGFASTLFFLTPVLHQLSNEPRLSEAVASIRPQTSPPPAPSSVLQATEDQSGRQRTRSTSLPSPKRDVRLARAAHSRKAQAPPQSRIARLILGDGSIDVRPFPTLDK